MTLLDVQDVTTGYGNVRIVDEASLAVERGEVVTIIGPNGAGKSTLMRAIARLLPLWDGDIRYNGESLEDVDAEDVINKGLCYVPQSDNIFPSLTVKENLKIGGWTLENGRTNHLENVYEHFPVLEKRENQRVGTMSGGERQMVAIGMALMVDPDMLLLDEPSAGLAPQIVEDVFENIKQINQSGKTILMVEQNARQALRISQRGVVLDEGTVELSGPSTTLLESPEIADLYLGQSTG